MRRNALHREDSRRGFPHRKTSHRDVLRPSCALFEKISSSAEDDKGFAHLTPPPFEKGGRKLFVHDFL